MALSLPPDSDLASLHSLLTSSLNTLNEVYSAKSKPLPEINNAGAPFDPAIDLSPQVLAATTTAVAACHQIVATIHNPVIHILTKTLGFHLSSSIRLVIEAHVPEALRQAGPQGLHVKDIATWSSVDPKKLGRVLRLLASNHIFVEKSPEVFAHTRLSVILDTGKSKEELAPEKKADWYKQTNGIAAVVAHSGDEVMKSSSYLADTLLDPELSHSYDAKKGPFAKAFNSDKGVWALFNENPAIGNRFEMAMVGTMSMQDPKAITKFYDWPSLPKDSLVVDVGGGMGHHSLTLLSEFSHLKGIVQDQKAPIENGKDFWKEKNPEAFNSGRVTLMEHDFFQPQPIKGADVYFMRAIIHDWADDTSISILSNLRSACSPNSVVLIIDGVNPYLSPPDASSAQGEGLQPPAAAPSPLLPQFGKAGEASYLADLQMLSAQNGQERTIGDWLDLTSKAGFKIQRISGNPALPMAGCLVCSPV